MKVHIKGRFKYLWHSRRKGRGPYVRAIHGELHDEFGNPRYAH